MPSTYEPIATQTLGSTTTSVTFSSISSAYTDLIAIVQVQTLLAGGALTVQFNSDTGSNYSVTRLYGNGTSASSDRLSNQTAFFSWGASTLNPVTYTMQLNNYSNTTTYKTGLVRISNAGEFTAALCPMWRNTAAINSITFSLITFPVGTTFTLYGIKAA